MDFDADPLGTICLWWFGIGIVWSVITLRRVIMRGRSISLIFVLLLWTAFLWPFGIMTACTEVFYKVPVDRT